MEHTRLVRKLIKLKKETKIFNFNYKIKQYKLKLIINFFSKIQARIAVQIAVQWMNN